MNIGFVVIGSTDLYLFGSLKKRIDLGASSAILSG
jgi:hypothetical protein